MSGTVLSIVVPVHNRAGSVAAALESTGLGADGRAEIVVVDDGSADGSADAARATLVRLRVPGRVETQANAGPGAARNRGAALAEGRFLAFLDSDDTWFSWTAAAVGQALAANPDATLVFLQTIDHPKDRRPVADPAAPLRTERHDGFLAAVAATGAACRFASCNVVVRRDVFERLGGFPTTVRCSEDTDLFLRADAEGTCLVLLGRPLVGHVTETADSLSHNVPCVVDGFRYLLARERAGDYPGGAGGDPRRKTFLAGSALYAGRMAFAAGQAGAAYRVLLEHAAFILRAGHGRRLLRLLLTPAVTAIRGRG